MENLERLSKLCENEEEAKKVFVDSIEETQKNLKDRGIDLSLDELRAFAQGASDANGDGELSEDTLENVSGGRSLYGQFLYNLGYKVGKALHQIVRWLKNNF